MSNSLSLPNLIVIGAGRSGTTSLYYYLRQHPNILMSPIKETNFFAYDPEKKDQLINIDDISFPIKDILAYQKLFPIRKKNTAIGENSPIYLWHPLALKNIYNHLPNVKLIAILRNPIDRAYSAYWHYVSWNIEKRSFSKAIVEEADNREKGKWPLGQAVYVGSGFYSQHLINYMDYFPREQIKICFYEDFQNNPLEVMSDIFAYIGVREDYIPSTKLRHNASGLPKNRLIHFILQPRPLTKSLRRHLPRIIHDPVFNFLMNIKDKNLVKPTMDRMIRKQLEDIYLDDIIQLGNFLNQNLSHWLEM